MRRVTWLGSLLAVAVLLAGGLVWSGIFTQTGCACPPQPSFDVEMQADGTTMLYEGGETVPAGELRVSVDGANATWAERASIPPDSEVVAGSTVSLPSADSGTTVSVVWTGPDGDQHQLLASETVPTPASDS